MRIHCLGTTGYHPSPTRHTACYFIPEWQVVLDAGTGFFRLTTLLREQPLPRLDILLSHAHLDHIIGLTFLLDLMAVTHVKEVRVVGAAEKLEAIERHLFNEHLFPLRPDLQFVPLEKSHGKVTLDAFELHWFPQQHPGGSLGYLLADPQRRVAYLTDTIAESRTLDHSLLRHCDLLLHECYFPDGQQELARRTGHSCLREVTEVVEQLRPQRTALIHTNPLAEVLGGEIELTDYHRDQLNMFIPYDQDVIEI
ncbi:MAG: ribonuclease Z [Pirellulaceae bacterium]|nr:MAG: ribonuclease Z [Pirellulaceae bacterium]